MLLLMPQCARVVAPTGGPRDQEPPRVVRTNPPNGSAGFRQRDLRIYLNEHISLQDPQKEIVVSPPLPIPPIAIVQGRSVLLQVGDSLRTNTTYSVQFGKAIVDLTERNPLPPYTYAFSTGENLDTCWIEGYVRDALLQSPKEKALALLYLQDSDSAATRRQPDFVAHANAQGEFLFTNLPPGSFWLATLMEKEGNMLYDKPQEEIGFSLHPISSECLRPRIVADTTTQRPNSTDSTQRPAAKDSVAKRKHPDLCVESFTQRWHRQRLLRAMRPTGNQLLFIFAERNKLPVEATLPQHPHLALLREAMGDTVCYWLMDTALAHADTLQVLLAHTSNDTTNQIRARLDTLRMGLPREPKQAKRPQPTSPDSLRQPKPTQAKPRKPALKLDLNTHSWDAFMPGDSIIITLPVPPNSMDTTRIALRHLPDSTLFPFRLVRHTDRPRRFTLHPPAQLQQAWRVELLPGAFVDAQGRTNDSLTQRVEMVNPAKRCVVRVALRNGPAHCLVQLISNDDRRATRYQEVSTTGNDTVTFRYVEAGTYGMRIVEDTNANGQWDGGDYYTRRLPERVRYFINEQGLTPLPVRTGWEYDFSIDYAELPQ